MYPLLRLIRYMIIGILFMIPGSAFGQISITSSDILALIGSSQVRETDTTGSMTINVGSSGANQTWDLTGVSVQGFTLPFNFISPQGTPFETDFPSANFVFSYTDTSGSEGYHVINSYEYVEVTTSHFSSLGYGVEIPDLDTTYVAGHSDEMAPLPLTYNSQWVSTESDTFGDPATFATINLDTTTNTVDGWGTVQLPIGNFDCLRIRADNKNTDITVVGGVTFSVNVSNTISYTWISKDNFAIAEAESQDNDTNPNFTNAASFDWIVSPITGIEDQPKVTLSPATLQLFQNYPNPFNPTTTIRYQLPKSADVVLSVYSPDGRLVKTLVNEYQNAGGYSINWNAQDVSSGVYFFRINAGNFSAVKKGILLK